MGGVFRENLGCCFGLVDLMGFVGLIWVFMVSFVFRVVVWSSFGVCYVLRLFFFGCGLFWFGRGSGCEFWCS